MADTTQSKPSDHLIAYSVKDIAGNRSVFRRIGAAFPHKEGPGFNLDLDAFPRDGKIVVLPPKDQTAEDQSGDE